MHRFIQAIRNGYRRVRRFLRRRRYQHLRAIIFDMDGVLRDSIFEIWMATRETLEHFGVPREKLPTYIEFCAYYEEPYERYYAQYGVVVDSKELLRVYLSYWHARRHAPKFFDEIEEVLRELRALGLKIAIVSMSNPDHVIALLRDRGLEEYFDVVVGGRHQKNEAMLDVCQILKVEPEEAAYVGDLRSDMAFADIAGLWRWARHYPGHDLPPDACLHRCEVDARITGTLHEIIHLAAARVQQQQAA
ncbi:MAG: hypothetical protein A2542_04050 [Parcubacteria group bacterium RIFOXYD2_FULL_52_8]|nr:MAG: hypothetical protein A2542_04050 [Parcubacteria group bacterium RIFOXYD2_FULL_52_8]